MVKLRYVDGKHHMLLSSSVQHSMRARQAVNADVMYMCK